jgi:cytochrome c
MIRPAPPKSTFSFPTRAVGWRRLQIWESGRFGTRRRGDAAMKRSAPMRFAAHLFPRLAIALGLVATAAHARDAPLTPAQAKQLFNAYGCNACHAVDEARIGPPYRAVALRYANPSPVTIEWLATKIVSGGAGSWGAVPMVSNPRLSLRDAQAAARWILSLERAGPDSERAQ